MADLIYLASPYSHDNPEVRESRYRAVCESAAYLLQRGHFVYSPIAHTHGICLHGGLPVGFEFYESFDCEMISRCDRMIVAKLDGWEESRGIDREIRFAMQIGKLVDIMSPEEIVVFCELRSVYRRSEKAFSS